MFIYNENDIIEITSINMTKDKNLLLVCDRKQTVANISVYNVSKLNFQNISIFRPKRKVVSSIYSKFKYASFSPDGNYIASIGMITSDISDKVVYQGVIWDVQILYQPTNVDNYKPKCIFDLPNGVNKITYENKILCTTGEFHFCLWQIYENTVKPYKNIKNLNLNENFVDHEWMKDKNPTIVLLTETNDIYVLEGISDIRRSIKEDDNSQVINKFIIRQHISNCFMNLNIKSNIIKTFTNGLIVGSSQGHLLFIEKVNLPDQTYKNVRYTSRDKVSKVVSLTINYNEEILGVAFSSNEICTISLNKIFENLKSDLFEIQFDVVCDGFHQGPITSMDVALQRPILITSSQIDKTIRVWNYLTGHCEYCKIILTEKDSIEKEIDLLSVAIHPNGFYIAVSDKDMIRFFHLCFKELRYYNNDIVGNESSKPNCHLLKFSHGGHLLAAVSNKTLYIIKSLSRETLKEFKTSHTGIIKGVFFDYNDNYVYTIGSEGIIAEYNLFTFKVEEFNTRHMYSGGDYLEYNDKTAILACGMYSNNRSILAEVKRGEDKEFTSPEFTQFSRRIMSLCHILSKKFNIHALVFGTADGYLTLNSLPSNENTKDVNIEYDFRKSHRSGITHILYSRDTNLIFSAGEDGNLFVYCLYELPDGEVIAMDDYKLASVNQLTAILDEGLGDNVIFPINKIVSFEKTIKNKSESILDMNKKEKVVQREFERRIIDKENECNRNREREVKEMIDIIKEMKVEKESTIEFYEEKIKNIINENNKILIEKERIYNDRMDQSSNIIHDLNSKLHFQENDNEIALKKKDEEYESKFRQLELELRKKFDELKLNNTKLTEELQQRQKLEDLKFNHLDNEHEQEMFYKQEKYETVITKLLGEISKLQNDFKQKCEQLANKEANLIEKENEIKKLEEQKSLLNYQNDKAKLLITEKENEYNELKKKFTESEKTLQEEKKIAGFSSKLKNELYRRNTDIMTNYNKQQGDINEMKVNTKSLESELEESLKLLENYEKELTNNKILIKDLKMKCDKEYANAKEKEKDMNNLLQKIYDTFQYSDKNKIISGIQEIHNLYLTGDIVRKIDSSKLNINIKDELEKQIDFLQKSLINVTEIRGKKEVIQKSEILRRTSENSTLITELNRMKTQFTINEKTLIHLKSENEALKKTVNNYKRKEKAFSTQQSVVQQGKSTIDIMNNQKNSGFSSNLDGNENDSFPLIPTFDNLNMSKELKSKRENFSRSKGKIYTGSNAVRLKVNEEQQKISQILQIIEEKNELILKQKLEIQRLKGINNI